MALPLIAASAMGPVIATVLKAFVVIFVGRLVLALGMAMVTFAGATTVADWITNYVITNITGIPADALGVVNAIGLIDAVNIVISAYVAAIGIKQLRGVYNRITFGQGGA